MTDKKISQLTAATTPLAGTEVLPIVQSGNTVKVAVNNLTAGKAVSVGSLSSAGAISGTTGAFSGNVTLTNSEVILSNAYYLKGKLVAGTNINLIGRNTSDEVVIDPDSYGARIGASGRYVFPSSGNFTIGLGNLVIGTAGKGIADSSSVDRVSIASGSTVVNESGADIDFRVESDTDANCLFVDASTNRVGIGTSTPDYKLHVTSGSTSTTAKVLSTSTTAYSPTTGAVVTNARMELWGGNATDSYTAIRFTHSGSFENYFGAVQNAAGTGEFVWGGYTGASYGEFARLTPAGILSIGGSAVRATTPGTAQLQIFNGNSPVGTLANGISIYSSSGEAYVMDAAGNATLFSPHDSETNEWIFKSKHTPSGKVLRIDVEKMLRFINEHFGLDAIQEFTEK